MTEKKEPETLDAFEAAQRRLDAKGGVLCSAEEYRKGLAEYDAEQEVRAKARFPGGRVFPIIYTDDDL